MINFYRQLILKSILIAGLFAPCLSLQAQLANKPASLTQVPAPAGQIAVRPADYSPAINTNHVRAWEATGAYQNEVELITAGYQHVRQSTQYLDGLGRPLQMVVRQASPGATPRDMVTPVVYDALGREAFKYLPYVQSSVGGDNGAFKLNTFTEQDNFYTGNAQYAGEQAFYGRTEFETSPLSRTLKMFAPGNSWAGSYNPSSPSSEKAVKTAYLTNIAGDAVKIWNITSNELAYDITEDASTNIPSAAINSYPQGELYKAVTIDEQGHAVVEYKNKEGRLILKKTQTGSIASDYTGYAGFACIYYIYDNMGQLRFVIPPKAVTAILSGWTISTAIAKELCFRYEYDGRGRLIARKVPGAGWAYMIYDTKDRQVFMQDANMRLNNQWLVTLYDALNRPVLTGMMVYTGGSSATLQSAVNIQTQPPTIPNTSTPVDLVLNGSAVTGTYSALATITLEDKFETAGTGVFTGEIVSGPSGPDGETTVIEGVAINKNPIPSGATFVALTKTYFDNYKWTAQAYSTGWNSQLDDFGDLHAEALPPTASTQVKGITTGTKIRVIEDPASLGTGPWLNSTNFYDDDGRRVQTQTDIYGGGTDILTTRYNFSGKILTTYQVLNLPGATELRVKTNMKYDHTGRLLETWKTINDESGKMALLAKNEYDALGQLSTKKLGRIKNSSGVYTTNPIETMDYSYNIRGWLKGVNKNFANSTTVNDNSRWFGMELNYDWGFGTNQYNGNIGGTKWRSRGDDKKRAFGFSYDHMNRFLEADFSQHDGSSYIDDGIVKFDVKMGTESIPAYDDNGNIGAMRQWGLKMGSSEMIDNLTYNYFSNSNKLSGVAEPTTIDHKLGDFTDKNAGGNDYGYDKNGNLVTDLNKRLGTAGSTGIDPASAGAIKYNHLNLPWQIQVKNDGGADRGTITYIYDATGAKQQKIVLEKLVAVTHNGGTSNMDITTTTYYLGGGVYEGKVYSNTGVDADLGYTRKLQFLGHKEGRIRPLYGNPAAPTTITDFVYDYMMKDHMGNVRMILTEEQKQDIYPAATLEGNISVTGSPNAVNIEQAYYQIDVAKIKDQPLTLATNYTNVNAAFANSNPSSSTGSNSLKMYELKASSSTAATGLGITLKVMAGDRIDITGRSYWNTSTSGAGPNIAPAVLDLLSGLLGSPGGATSGTHATASALDALDQVNDPLDAFVGDPSRNNASFTTRPKAFINYVFVDEQFKYVTGGFSPVSNTAGLKTDAEHLAQLQNLVANRNGYVYIYCSNESQVSVFFDNLQVSHTRGALLEETHYYPFGLTMAGISSKALTFGEPENKKKFIGQEFDTELDLNLYQFRYRNHDPQIGRFIQIDPLADSFVYNSMYAYAENKLGMGFDLEGLELANFNKVLQWGGINVEQENKRIQTSANNFYKKTEPIVSIAKDAITITAGVTLMVASAGTATPLLVGLAGSATITGGTMKLVFDIQGNSEAASQIPTSLGGTAIFLVNGATEEATGYKPISDNVKTIAEFSEGLLTLNVTGFDKMSDVLKVSNVLSGLSVTLDGLSPELGKSLQNILQAGTNTNKISFIPPANVDNVGTKPVLKPIN